MAEMTPMMKQYWKVKEDHPDCLLFFRLGDFYEMFHDDAKLGAEELGLTLTTRDRGKPEDESTCLQRPHDGFCNSLIRNR